MSATGTPQVVVVDTGRSNAASLMAALERAGAGTRLSTDAREVRDAQFAVLPGVGAFGPVAEGYVVRVAHAFPMSEFSSHAAKFVRAGHVQTDTHWMHTTIVPNQLARWGCK